MRKIVLILTVLVLTGCGVSIHSIVDESAIKKPYTNPLIVIFSEDRALYGFSFKLKKRLLSEFEEEGKKVEILIKEKTNKGLTLNAVDDQNQDIIDKVQSDKKDILLVFNATELEFYNNRLISVTYELVGIDTQTEREVWKASFEAMGTYGPATFVGKSANAILEELKFYNIL